MGSQYPRIAIVSCATGREFVGWTQKWMDSVEKTQYPGELTIDLIDDGSALLPYLMAGPRTQAHAVLKQDSISKAFNLALKAGLEHDPDFVCLVTTSTRPTSVDWIGMLVERLQSNPNCGIAGTVNVNDNGSLNHAGIGIIRMGDNFIMGHIGRDVNRREGLETIERMVEATTGACMLIRRCLLDFGVRFDENIKQFCNDVDFCFQAREHGYGVLMVPSVQMWRDEAHTRGTRQYSVPTQPDYNYFYTKWKGRSSAWL